MFKYIKSAGLHYQQDFTTRNVKGCSLECRKIMAGGNSDLLGGTQSTGNGGVRNKYKILLFFLS